VQHLFKPRLAILLSIFMRGAASRTDLLIFEPTTGEDFSALDAPPLPDLVGQLGTNSYGSSGQLKPE
jgi:hypothetical protein